MAEIACQPAAGPPDRPDTLSSAARAALAIGTPDETRRAYRSSLKQFRSWLTGTGRPDLPVPGSVLTEYATHLAYIEGVAPGTIERARWAIIKWHQLAEEPIPATSGLVTVLKGYRDQLAQTKDPRAVTRKATPASGGSIGAMIATLDRTTPAGKRDAALILLGFAIGGRRSEIASLDLASLDFRDAGMQVSVYRKKTRTMDDPVVHCRPDRAVCPVAAVLDWRTVLLEDGRHSGPLFVRISRHGQLAPPMSRNGQPIGDPAGRMTDHAVSDVIHRCAIAAGLTGRWTGHSLRRGLATSMHQAGQSRRAIERQGGWDAGSRVVSGYIDDTDRWLNDVLEGVL